jgi:thioredoxin 1
MAPWLRLQLGPLVLAALLRASAAASVEEVTSEAQFKKILSEHPAVVVDFYSQTCGPCIMMAPIYKEVAKEYDGRLKLIKVDVQRAHVGVQIRSMPTFHFYLQARWRPPGAPLPAAARSGALPPSRSPLPSRPLGNPASPRTRAFAPSPVQPPPHVPHAPWQALQVLTRGSDGLPLPRREASPRAPRVGLVCI